MICHLDDGADVFMELTVNTGKGYVSADKNRPEDAPIGLIPIDAIYSPVKKVSYEVTPTREGQVLDYDKLTMKIETDGSLTPDDAVAYAARILQDQLSIFVNFEEPNPPRGEDRLWAGIQPAAAEEGGRAGAFGPFGQLPEERQHRLYRRPDPEDRGGDAPYPELRPQVVERDQGSAFGHGPASWAWTSKAGRQRISRTWPSVSRTSSDNRRVGSIAHPPKCPHMAGNDWRKPKVSGTTRRPCRTKQNTRIGDSNASL